MMSQPKASPTPSIPNVIDIEASGFGRRSYPIEIGIALSNGKTHCFLIKPPAHWNHWDEEGENTHGITREILMSRGLEIEDVAQRLNRLLENKTIYSDGWGMDISWLGKLFHEANMLQQFELAQLQSLFAPEQYEQWHDTHQHLQQELNITRHRASSDAFLIQQTFIRTRA